MEKPNESTLTPDAIAAIAADLVARVAGLLPDEALSIAAAAAAAYGINRPFPLRSSQSERERARRMVRDRLTASHGEEKK